MPGLLLREMEAGAPAASGAELRGDASMRLAKTTADATVESCGRCDVARADAVEADEVVESEVPGRWVASTLARRWRGDWEVPAGVGAAKRLISASTGCGA